MGEIFVALDLRQSRALFDFVQYRVESRLRLRDRDARFQAREYGYPLRLPVVLRRQPRGVQRRVKIGRFTDFGAEKFRRRDSNHGERVLRSGPGVGGVRLISKRDHLADRGGTRIQFALPECEAHHQRRRTVLIGTREQTSGKRTHAQRLEIIRRDKFAVGRDFSAVNGHFVRSDPGKCQDAGERRSFVAVRIVGRKLRTLRRSPKRAGGVYPDEFIRIRGPEACAAAAGRGSRRSRCSRRCRGRE